MYAISLTSIPPRFARLAPVLAALRAQRPAPAAIFLCLPEAYARFPGPGALPALPEGVTLLHSALDDGPGMKALVAARHLAGRLRRLIWCDDDWIAGPGWAAALLATQRPGMAVTGQGFGVERLGRHSTRAPGCTDIAQGFSGVLADPAWLADATPPTDAAARAVDDIWLSAHLAAKGVAVCEAPDARAMLTPAFNDVHGLQSTRVADLTRAQANRRCAALMHEAYGIWPVRA